MLKGLLSAARSPDPETTSVYPFPAWSILRSENVATPFTNDTVFVPDSVPGKTRPPFFPIATVAEPVNVLTVLPRSSTAATLTAGVMVIKGNVVLGWTVTTMCVAAGLRTTAVASQLPGWVGSKNQVHCGLTVPPPDNTACCASAFMKLSLMPASCRNGGPGWSKPTKVPDIVTP